MQDFNAIQREYDEAKVSIGLTPEHAMKWVLEFAQKDLWDNYNGPASDKLLIDIYQHWLEPAS